MDGRREGKMPVKMEPHDGASKSVEIQKPELKSSAPARQGSLCCLTLDEVQNQLGFLAKPLASMNIDELLKIVSTAEVSQGIGGEAYVASLQHHQGVSGSSLQRQPSYMLSRDLSNKTVHEVWQEIQQRQESLNLDSETPKRQATLGEMTMEDFLVRAGVIVKTAPRNNQSGLVLGVDPIPLPPQQTDYQAPSNHHQQPHPLPQQQNPKPIFIFGHPIVVNQMMDVASPEPQMNVETTTLTGTMLDAQTPGGNRVTSGRAVATSAEKLEKRKARNRESAARSRANKLAHISELENKVSQLKGTNERLKKEQLFLKNLPKPRNQLRRTSSAPF